MRNSLKNKEVKRPIDWTPANGGVTAGGLRGVCPPFLEIGRDQPFSHFFALFQKARTAPGNSRKQRKEAFFLTCPPSCLNPHLLKPYLRHPKLRLMGCFRAAPPRWKTAPLKRPMKRSVKIAESNRKI